MSKTRDSPKARPSRGRLKRRRSVEPRVPAVITSKRREVCIKTIEMKKALERQATELLKKHGYDEWGTPRAEARRNERQRRKALGLGISRRVLKTATQSS